MARAAAKRKATPKPPAGRGPRPSRAARKANRPVEETLFFHRIRKGTKWVFALLALAFAFSFVVAGVGSGSTGFGSVVDALGGLFGRSSGSSGPSVSKALKRIQKNPKDAPAYFEAAQAYQTKNQDIQAITYYEGIFKISQGRSGQVVATLVGGNFSICGATVKHGKGARAGISRRPRKRTVRKLWGDGHGSYSTKGNYAAGAVLGTRWLTEDRCDGTLVRVVTDRVKVTNLVNHSRVTVKAGQSYLAKAP